MSDSDLAGFVIYFHADKSLVFSYTVLFLTPSSLAKAVFDERALTLGQGQFTQNKQIAKPSLWSGPPTRGGEVDGRGRSHPSHPSRFFPSSSKIPFLNTSGWETNYCQSK